MKKRNVFTLLMLLSVSILLVTALVSCNKTPRKYIGLQLYSIRDSITRDVPGAIEKIGKMGYTFVEAAGYRDGKFYGIDPVPFRDLCEKNGVPFISTHTGRPLPSTENMDEAMAWWDECIAAHKAAGCKFIVQPSMGREAYRSLDTLKMYCDYFNTIGEKCNAVGIRFGYHNHANEFSTRLDGHTIYDFMLENTDPAKVMFEIDLYWAVVGGANPVDYFNKYPGRFELWHIKDKAEVGASGMMDYASIWAAAGQSGMKYGIVEVEEYHFDQFTSCEKSLEFLNEAAYVKMPQPEGL